jgi:peptidase M20/M25/M40-like protein
LTPVELLQQLIRFDTTNPPGNESECIGFVRNLLEEAGCETQTYSKDTGRPNLVAKLQGAGDRPPLLLQGQIWGRGAIDMKGAVAMFVSAFLRAAAGEVKLPGDVILVVLSDEKVNVIPAQIDLELDGRLLPCFTPDDLIGELHAGDRGRRRPRRQQERRHRRRLAGRSLRLPKSRSPGSASIDGCARTA